MSELEVMFKHLRHTLLHVVPLTISGYLLVTLIYVTGFYDHATVEYLVTIAETGLYISAVGACYYIGWGAHLLISKLLSIFTHETRSKEEPHDSNGGTRIRPFDK